MRLRKRAPVAEAKVPGEEGLYAETWAQEHARRLAACEMHFPDLEDRLTLLSQRVAQLEQKPVRRAPVRKGM